MAANSRILTVDDRPQIRKLLTSLLKWPFTWYQRLPAKRARNHSSAGESFDLLLSDVVMPEMNAPVGTVGGGPPSINTHCADVGYDPGASTAASPRCHLIAKPFQPDRCLRSLSAPWRRS